jgi:hypothetical protein
VCLPHLDSSKVQSVDQTSTSTTWSNFGVLDETIFPLAIRCNYSDSIRTYQASIEHGFKRRLQLNGARGNWDTTQTARGAIALNKIGRIESGWGTTHTVSLLTALPGATTSSF